jgi:hypothetical protein
MEENMRVITVVELVGLNARELRALYFKVGQELPGTRPGSPERLAVEQSLANIRLVLARRHPAPR